MIRSRALAGPDLAGARRRRARPGHFPPSPTSSTSTCRPRPTPMCTPQWPYRPVSGARGARSPSSSPSRRRSSRRSSRHRQELTEWTPGGKTEPARIEEKPKRHTKPQLTRNGAEEYRRCWRGLGERMAGSRRRHPCGDQRGGVDGEGVRDVRVLERFTLSRSPTARLTASSRRSTAASWPAGPCGWSSPGTESQVGGRPKFGRRTATAVPLMALW